VPRAVDADASTVIKNSFKWIPVADALVARGTRFATGYGELPEPYGPREPASARRNGRIIPV